MNKKGFTVIELILSFAFVSILTVTMFQLVLNYKEKEQIAQDITELTSFKNNITMMIEKDLQVNILKTIDYCREGGVQGEGAIINRCITLYFQNNTQKDLRIAYKEETVNVVTSHVKYNRYFIIYGDEIYEAPSSGEVEIRTDYMLEYSTKEDSLENHLGLYKIRIGLYHKGANANSEISIVAIGNTKANAGTGAYKAYTVGQKLRIQVNSGAQGNQNYFYVIKNSDTFDGSVTLLYDGIWTGTHKYNSSLTVGNAFESSELNSVLDTVYSSWNNVSKREDVRLLTANEITSLGGQSPLARNYDTASPINIPSNAVTSILNAYDNFWTSSPYLSNSNSQYAWVYSKNGSQGKLVKTKINEAHGVRPVIKIEKKYIMGVGQYDY